MCTSILYVCTYMYVHICMYIHITFAVSSEREGHLWGRITRVMTFVGSCITLVMTLVRPQCAANHHQAFCIARSLSKKSPIFVGSFAESPDDLWSTPWRCMEHYNTLQRSTSLLTNACTCAVNLHHLCISATLLSSVTAIIRRDIAVLHTSPAAHQLISCRHLYIFQPYAHLFDDGP